MNNIKPYTKYKPSGIEWLGDIPEHWEVSKIKWLTPVKRGASPRPIDNPIYFDIEGGFSWVRISDVSASKRYLLKTKEKLSDLGASLSVKQYPNDLFLSIAGTVGKPIITKIKCCIHDGFVYFPNLKIDSEFLYYIFITGLPYQGLGKMGTQLNLNTETVGTISIPIPDANEISIIAAFLDFKLAKIDRFIRKKKQLVKLLNEQKAAIINQAVTKGISGGKDAMNRVSTKPSGIEWLGDIPEHWEVRKLKYVADFQSGEMITSESIDKEGEYPVFGGGGFRGYTDNFTNDGSHVLIGRQGALCGNIKYANGKFWASEHSIVTYPKIAIETIYLGEILVKCNLGKLSQTAAQPGIAIGQIKNVSIPVPPLPEQLAIVTHIETETAKLNQTISTIEKEITLVQEYKTALIAEAVTGKIDVRNYEIPEIEETESFEEIEEELSMVAEDEVAYETNDMD